MPLPDRGPRHRLPVTWRPYLFAAIQSCLTSGFATGVAALQLKGASLTGWLFAWGVAWVLVLPVVVVAAPFIRRLVERMTG